MPFWHVRKKDHAKKPHATKGEWRLLFFACVIVIGTCAVIARLFVLQVLSHTFYSALATEQHGIFENLFPERGIVYVRDPKSPDGRFPAILNRTAYVAFADTRKIKDANDASTRLAVVLGDDPAKIHEKLLIQNDPYVPLAKKLDPTKADAIRALGIKGIGLAEERERYYPEGHTLSHVTGFLGSDGKGGLAGHYGIEGYWNTPLVGQRGIFESDEDSLGGMVGSATKTFRPAKDGDELTLTIDRTIQFVACDKLKQAVAKHHADGGSLVIADPKTGAILAICGVPDFDPNEYAHVKDIGVFNNPTVFEAYEPGSIFKAITLASAIDAGRITPNSTYRDEGQVQIGAYTIRNSDLKTHGVQTMTQVLSESLNTGTIFAVRQLGAKPFLKYVENFGFGSPTGIELDTESAGDIESLRKKGDIWSATASFGQGITVTPIQMLVAYGALANGGKLMQPYIVGEVRHADGTVEKTQPKAVRQVITKRASTLIGGMLVDVVEHGHGKHAAVPGYWVAGKTGTAQIPNPAGGYFQDQAIGSFVGFAPADDPAFVMLVRIDRPRDVQWAESSVAPAFGEIAKFLLQYMEIQPERKIKD